MIAMVAVTTAVVAVVDTTIVPRPRLAVLVATMLLPLARKPTAAGRTRTRVTINEPATMASGSKI
jgi:hypothetical protein